MPPLRERLDDLPILIEHLVCRQGQNAGRHIRLERSALECLGRNRWPGNVRELSNLLERLAILYPDQTITAADLPERYRASGPAIFAGSEVRIVTRVTGTVDQDQDQDEGEGEGEEDLCREGLELSEGTEDGPAVESALKNGGINLKDHLSAIEIGLIRKALEEADGTVAEAARLLNMRRTTLVEKLRKYRLYA
jgi:sigma-54 specific flagellar transcriptional regulator A